MGAFSDVLKDRTTHDVGDLSCRDSQGDFTILDGSNVRIAGIITALKKISTKKGQQMCFLTIADEVGRVDVTVFPSVYAAYGSKLIPGTPILIIGKAEVGDEVRIVASSIDFVAEF